MIKLSELLDPHPGPLWTLVKQCGVDHAVALLDGGEQQQRWLVADGEAPTASPSGLAPWAAESVARIVERFAAAGLTVAAFEDTAPMDAVRLGTDGRQAAVEALQEQILAMGRAGVGVLCYNWMALTSWARTDLAVLTRGGALTTGFRLAETAAQEPLAAPGVITAPQLWQALDDFLDEVLPVAEAAGVRLALHPDDPPLAAMRGVPRIINSLDSYRRLWARHPSPANAITLCQGNVALMTDDLPAAIREFADRIAFVHFRDVAGTAADFVETFHDAGPTDLAACMRAYHEIGFDGPMRPDHVPTLHGETNARPGYASLGRLFAVGYIRGLEHGSQMRSE